jgi:7-cyano-7-deazaguanine synthase in queuosine biosynthesis
MNITVEIDDTHRKEDGLASILLSGEQMEAIELDLPFRVLHRSFGSPDTMALDLLVTASACYVADKCVDRGNASDVWTRELSLSVPVTNPKTWSNVSARLDEALSFLSGDVWHTSFHALEAELFIAPKIRRRAASPNEPTQFDAVSLFSGGLDSLIGAIDFLEHNARANLLLVGHYDAPGPRSQQRGLAEGLSSAYPGRTKLIQVRVAQRPLENAESTLRTRSIVFMALGLYVASELGCEVPLLAPENGFIALNLPLTPSRIGSCSTRTMHPFYLGLLRTVINDLGLKNTLINPLELKTKAECVSECRNPMLLSALARKSVSCSHGTRRQYWKRKSATNCGYCMPCLLRRTSLHAVGLDAGTDYGIDVCADELRSDYTSADDLRALVDALSVYKKDAAIRRAITNVACVEPLDTYIAMVARGLGQIRIWLKEKGSPSIRTQAGFPVI